MTPSAPPKRQRPYSSLVNMSAWDQTVVIGRKARPGGSGGGGGPRGPTALERAKQVGAVTANDRKSMYARS